MRFRLLGPIDVDNDGPGLEVGGGRQAAVLAALLLQSNRLVTRAELIQKVWHCPPHSVESNLRTYLSRLKPVVQSPLELDPRLTTNRSGHRLRLRPGELDVAQFSDLAARGERALGAGDVNAACDFFAKAQRLWRGRPFGGAYVEAELELVAVQLQERHQCLVEQHLKARLGRGEHHGVVTELRSLVIKNPLREQLAEILMVALYRFGRRDEALAVYRRVRDQLARELDVAPGPGLERIHRAILQRRPEAVPQGAMAVTGARRRQVVRVRPRPAPAGARLAVVRPNPSG